MKHLGSNRCKPGLAPAGEALFFASPKKSTQKKGDPMVWVPCAALRGNLRCSPKAGSSSNSASPQTIARPDPLLPTLLGPARRVGERVRMRGGEDAQSASSPAAGCAPASDLAPTPSACAEERRSSRIRASDCLSAASSSSPPAGPSTAGCPAAKRRGRRQRGRLFFAYFLLATQKKVSSCRATPGPQSQPTTGSCTSLHRNSKQKVPPAHTNRAQPAIHLIALRTGRPVASWSQP